MYRCSIREMVTEKLQNCNGFYGFKNLDKDKEFSFNFRQRHDAFISTDAKRFKILTSNMGPSPPPSWEGFIDYC